jgi:DNA-binding NtrC family response regulator
MPGSVLTIGRFEDNDVIIDHDTVSRLHARIRVTDRVIVEDAASRNGIRVNGERVRSGIAVELEPGAVVQIGPATMYLVEGWETKVPLSARDSAPRRIAQAGAAAARIDAQTDGSLVIEDERMALLYQSAWTIASSAISVLLLGERGVGKERLAYWMHCQSSRAAQPFVTFNSASVTEAQVEGELFGYEQGAFAGADRPKRGLFEAADGGTIFLDEVADLSLPVQDTLLQVVATGEVPCGGGLNPRAVDVRVVSATTSDLYALTTAGRFRRDLYYRLSGATLHMPPLRHRAAEIPTLVEHFAAQCAESARVPTPRFDDACMGALLAHSWPGNVRELRNVVERVARMALGRPVRVTDLRLDSVDRLAPPPQADVPRLTPTSPSPASDVTRGGIDPASAGYIRAHAVTLQRQAAEEDRTRAVEALAKANGNEDVAARSLGISREALVRRLDPSRRRSGKGQP